MAFRISFMLVFILSFFSCAPAKDEKAVAFMESDGSFSVNAEKAESKMLHDLRGVVKDFHTDIVEVRSVVPMGDKHKKVYFLQLTDSTKGQKLSRYLFLIKDKLYFYEDLAGKKPADDNTFFISYYIVTGSKENNCFINVAYTDKELYWITGDVLACIIDSPCKSQQHILVQ